MCNMLILFLEHNSIYTKYQGGYFPYIFFGGHSCPLPKSSFASVDAYVVRYVWMGKIRMAVCAE